MSVPVIPYHDSDIVYRGSDIKKPEFPQLNESHRIDNVQYYVTEDTPLNKRNFMYQPCTANLMLERLKYCNTDYSDTGCINYTDRSDKLAFNLEDESVSVNASCGWRSIRSDVCMKEGQIYWEVEVKNLSDSAHIRCGISRREASMETPVGCDMYGYGIKDHGLDSVHEGRLTSRLQPYQLKAGDRIGFLLSLPSLECQNEQAIEFAYRRINDLNNDDSQNNKRNKKVNKEFYKFLLRTCEPSNVIRDQIAIRYKSQLFYESTDYVKTTKKMYRRQNDQIKEEDTLKESSLEVYVNGESKGKAFENLLPFLPPFSELQYNEKFYLNQWNRRHTTKNIEIRNKYVNNNRLGYYVTLSSFQGGTATIIADPHQMKYLPKLEAVKPLAEVYNEQVASDVVWDIIDEVDIELTGSN